MESKINEAISKIEYLITETQPEWDEFNKKAHNRRMEIYHKIGMILMLICKEFDDKKDYYDLLGNLITKYMNFFDTRFSLEYDSTVALPIKNELNKLNLELYFLKKYSFYDGERIISNFNGSLIHTLREYKFYGRLFFTNYRIIALGKYEKKTRGLDAFLLGGYFYDEVAAKKSSALTSAKSLLTDIYEKIGKKVIEKPILGYQFSILNAFNANLGSKSLSFKSDRRYTIGLTKLYKEKNKTFQERVRISLEPIYEFLLKNR